MVYLNKLIYLIIISVILSGDANHLVFNRISVNPNEAELIEIYNPTNETINLSNYYLSDQNDYYNWIFGNSSNLNSRDFVIKFPEGSEIKSQESFLITTLSNDDFFDYYDGMPDISLIDTNFEISEIGLSAGLDNSQEMLILFYWDGVSEIIQDVDYFLWGSTLRGFSKTIDEGYTYNDTSIEDQFFIRNYSDSDFTDSLYVRNNISENSEIQLDGNGITGHDETSENFVESWSIIGNEKEISFQDIINGDYLCGISDSRDACPLGSAADCDIVNPKGVIVDYFDITQFGGPHALTIQDEEGLRVELTIWPDNWDIGNDPDYSMLLEAPYNRFYVQGFGNAFDYQGEPQIQICSEDDFKLLESYDMDGLFEDFDDIDDDGTLTPSEPLFSDEDTCDDFEFNWRDESFIDIGNGIWNSQELYEDSNENGIWDEDELFTDSNENGIWDEDELFTDSNENGIWDQFCSISLEACIFYNIENGMWDEDEPFEDLNENGIWDEAEPFEDLEGSSWIPDQTYPLNWSSIYIDNNDVGFCFHDLNANGIWDEVYEEKYNFIKTSINPVPYVLLASENERLDYTYSFPSNSRVIIRVFDISGRFITTLADKHYTSSGIVKREEDSSSWDGRNHMGQILSPGTYLMHIETSNFQTGYTTIDVAPVVIGVRNK